MRMLALIVNNLIGMLTMSNGINILGGRHKYLAPSMEDELPLTLEMPSRYDGTTVLSSTVVTALLWQQFGLDLLHPEVNRWLEKYAPDVKYAVAVNSCDVEQNSVNFRVGWDGTLKVHLSPDVDERLRRVSSDYIWWQVEHAMDPGHKDMAEESIEQIAGVLNDARSKTFKLSVAG